MTNKIQILMGVAVLGVFAIILTGCGSKKTTPVQPATPIQQAPDLLPMGQRPLQTATTVLVSIKNRRFLPSVIAAQVGDTIKWTNEDSMPHTVVGTELNSPRLAPGESYQAVVTKAGTYDYACGIHPDMKGQIKVQPAP
jgi:plastocyanin